MQRHARRPLRRPGPGRARIPGGVLYAASHRGSSVNQLGDHGAFLKTELGRLALQSPQREWLAGRQDLDAFRIFDPAQQRVWVGVERWKVGSIHAPPVVQQQWRVRVGIRHRDRAVEGEVPLAVGEVEQHGIGGRHAQMMVGDEP